MRIAFLVSQFPLQQNPGSVFPAGLELVRCLKQQGHEVLVLTFGGENQPEILRTEVEGVTVLAARWDKDARKTLFDGVHSFGVFSWQIARARLLLELFRDELEQFKPDVVESQEFNALGFFYAAERKYPLVVRCHGPMSLLMRSNDCGNFAPSDVELTEAMELSTIAAADKVITLCQDLAGRLSLQTQRPLTEFTVVRTPFVLPPQQQLPELSANPAPRIFYFGRVERQKGVDLLVEALPLIAAKYPNVVMRIGGPETIEAGDKEPYARHLRARLAELNMAHKVEFLGFLSHDRIKDEVAQADVCVFPSKYETACYAVLETIAYGGIPVAAKAGGLPEYHKHGESAWLVESHSPQALAEGVIHVASDLELRKTMREKGRAHIAVVCNPQEIAKQSVEVYQQAIDSFTHTQSTLPTTGARTDTAFKIWSERLGAALPDASIHEYLVQSISAEVDRAYKAGQEAGRAEQPRTVGSFVWAAARVTKRFVSNRMVGTKGNGHQ